MTGLRSIMTSEPLLGLFTIVGGLSVLLTALLQWWRSIIGLIGGRPVLRLHRNETADLVVTTSEVQESAVGAAIRRPTTGYGQIITIMHATRTIAKLYGKKSRLAFHFSQRLGRHRMDRDLIVVGGPAKNGLTASLLAAVSRRPDVPKIHFDDIEGTARVGSAVFVKDLRAVSGDQMDEDYALIMGLRNPFDPNGHARALLIAGFTSYGTAVAGEILFEMLTNLRWRLREIPQARKALVWPREFAMIVHISDPTGKATSSSVVAFVDLKAPRIRSFLRPRAT
jgi:hypothetical protein